MNANLKLWKFNFNFFQKAPTSLREEKLEAMERKLKNMEEYVLQDTAKYAEISEGTKTVEHFSH